MTHIEFFKLQAKNLLRDYKTQYQDKDGLFQYQPRFFIDIDDIVLNYNIREDEPFTLMNAQHIISRLSGFDKWGDLLKATIVDLEIGKLSLGDPESRRSAKAEGRLKRAKLSKEYYLANNPFHCSNWDANVECLHCETQFLFNNAEVDEDGLIICPVKNCDGTLIDFQRTAAHSKKWTPIKYKELAKELADAMKPLKDMGMPLTMDFPEEISEGLEPKFA